MQQANDQKTPESQSHDTLTDAGLPNSSPEIRVESTLPEMLITPAMLQANNSLANNRRCYFHLSYPLKFLIGVMVTNGVITGLDQLFDETAPETIEQLASPAFALIQTIGISMSLPLFVMGDIIVAALHNRKVTAAREAHQVTEDDIKAAKGKLDGFKYIDPFALLKEVGKFLAITAPLFLTFVYLSTAIMLVPDNLTRFSLLFGLTNFITLTQVLGLHVADVHPTLTSFLQFDMALFGIGTADILLDSLPRMVHHIASIIVPALFCTTTSAVPAIMDTIGSYIYPTGSTASRLTLGFLNCFLPQESSSSLRPQTNNEDEEKTPLLESVQVEHTTSQPKR